MNTLSQIVTTLALSGVLMSSSVAGEGLKVNIDVSEAPEHKVWIEDGAELMREWYPRLRNLLAGPGAMPVTEMKLSVKKSDKGVAFASGRRVVVMSGWIEKRPGDVGLLIHELAHLVQGYPAKKGPSWLTEGIADYARWAIYEGRPLGAFPRGRERKGYEMSYQVTAGFLFWLESGRAPGIVRRLNTAMRGGAYSPELFEQHAGAGLDALWKEYYELREKAKG